MSGCTVLVMHPVGHVLLEGSAVVHLEVRDRPEIKGKFKNPSLPSISDVGPDNRFLSTNL